MPAYCTHYLFACDMMEPLQNISEIKINSDAVLLGTQGPDIFFFHRIVPWMFGHSLNKTGSALHRAKPADIFDAMAEYCNKTSDEKGSVLSYVYGFILHYALDRKCHPFVYSKQNELKKCKPFTHNSTIHNQIEMSMDSAMLSKLKGIKNPRSFNAADTFPQDENLLKNVSALLAYCVPRCVKTKNSFSEKQIMQAFKDTKTVQKILHDEHGLKSALLQIPEDILFPITGGYRVSSMIRPKDLEKTEKYGNITNKSWRSPYESGVRYESFFDLYELAKADAIELVCGFNRILSGLGNGADVTKNKSFLTGVEVK